ncbi:MAG: hypothetical protein EAY81_09040 [Bacteroidetes bacterium]|nr:MAG: hypothetical protein EAY81_09040 [Bacteroidota bacterium]
MKKIIHFGVLLLGIAVSQSLTAQQLLTWDKIIAENVPQKKLDMILQDGMDVITETNSKVSELITLTEKLGVLLGDERAHIMAINFKAVQCRLDGKLDSAYLLLSDCQNLLKGKNYKELEAITYNNIGIVYKTKNQSDKHLAYIDSALTICKQHKLERLENRYLMNKAYLVFAMGKPEEAIHLSLFVIKRFNKPENLSDKCVAYNNLGIFYRMTGKYDSAIICCKRAVNIALQQNLRLYLADGWCELGYLEEIQGNGKQAIKYINAADSIYSLTDDYLGRYRVVTFKIAAFTKSKNYDKALNSVQELITIANKFQNINWLGEAYKEKSAIEEQQGNYALALKSLKQHLFWADSFNRASGNAKLAELEFKYQTKDKDNQLRMLQKDAELHKQRQFLGYSVAVILLLLVLGVSLYFAIKIKNRKVVAEKEKQQLLFQLEAQQEEIQLKSRQLTSKALYISERNELLEELLKMTKQVGKQEPKQDLVTIERKIRNSLANNKDWEEFKTYFEELNPNYLNRVKQLYNDLTERELRLIAFVKIGLNTKEIANILHVESNSVKTARYRLKKKFNLDLETSLEQFLNSI